MSVSVSTSQLRILLVAIVVVAFGRLIVVSIDNGRAATSTSIAESPAGTFAPTLGKSAQPLVRSQGSTQARDRAHHLALRDSNARAHDPPSLPARARPAVAPPLSTVENEEMLRPRSGNPVRVQTPVGVQSVLADTDTASVMVFASRRDPDDALATMATLADIYDDIRTSPMWPDSLPSPASLTPAELVSLLGICSGVTLGIYGLFAFSVRRRSDRPS